MSQSHVFYVPLNRISFEWNISKGCFFVFVLFKVWLKKKWLLGTLCTTRVCIGQWLRPHSQLVTKSSWIPFQKLRVQALALTAAFFFGTQMLVSAVIKWWSGKIHAQKWVITGCGTRNIVRVTGYHLQNDWQGIKHLTKRIIIIMYLTYPTRLCIKQQT